MLLSDDNCSYQSFEIGWRVEQDCDIGVQSTDLLHLPPNHPVLLTHHLRSRKASSRIVMSKNSYGLREDEGFSRPRRGRLPKSKAVPDLAPKPVVHGLADEELSKMEEGAEPRPLKRGRPAKSKNSGPVEGEETDVPANGADRPKRGRGRPDYGPLC